MAPQLTAFEQEKRRADEAEAAARYLNDLKHAKMRCSTLTFQCQLWSHCAHGGWTILTNKRVAFLIIMTTDVKIAKAKAQIQLERRCSGRCKCAVNLWYHLRWIDALNNDCLDQAGGILQTRGADGGVRAAESGARLHFCAPPPIQVYSTMRIELNLFLHSSGTFCEMKYCQSGPKCGWRSTRSWRWPSQSFQIRRRVWYVS